MCRRLFFPSGKQFLKGADGIIRQSEFRRVARSEANMLTATSPIERVVLTHLQIPLKESFRTSGGEVAIKDAILVTVETSSGIGHGESSPMAASFGYSSDTPDELLGRPPEHNRSQPDRPDNQLYRRDRGAGLDLDRQPIRSGRRRERPVGLAGTGPPCDHRPDVGGDR